jgi:hypothetical protein
MIVLVVAKPRSSHPVSRITPDEGEDGDGDWSAEEDRVDTGNTYEISVRITWKESILG